jgi:hypothetical protein
VDFLIVTPHWGAELVSVPPEKVIKHAHAMADAGADLVLGHHPHVLQGTERYGKCLIVYSLGDFLFDDWLPWLTETAMFRCTIEGGGTNPEFEPRNQLSSLTGHEGAVRRILRRMTQYQAIVDPKLAWLRDAIEPGNGKRMKRRLVLKPDFVPRGQHQTMGPRFAQTRSSAAAPSSWPKKQQALTETEKKSGLLPSPEKQTPADLV